jgi:hypothetical protein
MAAFTSQFERTNPFLRPNAFDYFGWLYQLWDEIAQLLKDVPVDRRITIAKQIEALLTKSVEQKQFSQSGGMQRVAQSEMYKDAPIEDIRLMYGDFNLLKEVHDSHNWNVESTPSTKWERYAVFSLWKMCDACWEEASNQTETGFIEWPEEGGLPIRMPNPHVAMAYYFEAMRAHQVAETTLLTDRLLSARNRDNTLKAQQLSETNRLKALAMAESKPFRSLEKAATYVAEHLVKGRASSGEGTTYSVDWIKQWLREDGWKPVHKRAPLLKP